MQRDSVGLRTIPPTCRSPSHGSLFYRLQPPRVVVASFHRLLVLEGDASASFSNPIMRSRQEHEALAKDEAALAKVVPRGKVVSSSTQYTRRFLNPQRARTTVTDKLFAEGSPAIHLPFHSDWLFTLNPDPAIRFRGIMVAACSWMPGISILSSKTACKITLPMP